MTSTLDQPTTTDTTTESELFDPAPFTLPIPTLDGTKADKLHLTFTGTIELDPTSEDDLDLIGRLSLDQDVTLTVEAAVAGKAFKVKRVEDETTATHVVTARVHSLQQQD